jgi:predicted XRE-type DNA-binding protein
MIMTTPLDTTTLSELRLKSGNIKQAIIALEMGVQDPAVSKLEKKRVKDVSVDKLMRFVEALGGRVALSVELPDGRTLTL